MGEPPFGAPAPATDAVTRTAAADPSRTGAESSLTGPAATWGIPGTSGWARADETSDSAPGGASTADTPSDPVIGTAPSPAGSGTSPGPVDPGTPALDATQTWQPVFDDAEAPDDSAGSGESATPASSPEGSDSSGSVGGSESESGSRSSAAGAPDPVHINQTQQLTGLFGEQLAVTLTRLVDPADRILVAAGFRMDEQERAVLVETTVQNDGPADFEALADLYLTLIGDAGQPLRRAPMAVPGYPPHRVGVSSGEQGTGWTVFLVPADTRVSAVRWSVRPDLEHRTVTWTL